jgi:hypothetical protein
VVAVVGASGGSRILSATLLVLDADIYLNRFNSPKDRNQSLGLQNVRWERCQNPEISSPAHSKQGRYF